MCLEYENGCFRLKIKTCNFMDRLLNNLVLSEKVQIALFTSYFSFRKLKKILHIQINSIQAYERNTYFYHFRMVIQANGKEYHSVEIQLGSVLIPKDKIES